MEPSQAMPARVEDFLSYIAVERGYSDNTLAAYRNDLAQLADFLAGRSDVSDWPGVGQDVVVDYVLGLRDAALC
jgi:integrase/recombinase XerD